MHESFLPFFTDDRVAPLRVWNILRSSLVSSVLALGCGSDGTRAAVVP